MHYLVHIYYSILIARLCHRNKRNWVLQVPTLYLLIWFQHSVFQSQRNTGKVWKLSPKDSAVTKGANYWPTCQSSDHDLGSRETPGRHYLLMNTTLTNRPRTSLERWWNNYQGPRDVCPPEPIPPPIPARCRQLGLGPGWDRLWGWDWAGLWGAGDGPAVAAASLGQGLMALEGWVGAVRPGGAHWQ